MSKYNYYPLPLLLLWFSVGSTYAQEIPSVFCEHKLDTLVSANLILYCSESRTCTRFGYSREEITCLGQCGVPAVNERWCRTRNSPKVPPEGTPGFRANITFVQTKLGDGSNFCQYIWDLRDDRDPLNRFSEFATSELTHKCCGPGDGPCPGCPWEQLVKDPRFVWVDRDRVGSLISNSLQPQMDTNACRKEPGVESEPSCPGPDRVASYGTEDWGEGWLGGYTVPWVPAEASTIVYRKTKNGLPACLSRDSRNCIWTSFECATGLRLSADRYSPYLECGERHREVWGDTGFDDPNSWCSVLKQRM